MWKEKTTLNETDFTKLANHQAISDTVHGTERVGILLYNQTQKLARIQVFCYYWVMNRMQNYQCSVFKSVWNRYR